MADNGAGYREPEARSPSLSAGRAVIYGRGSVHQHIETPQMFPFTAIVGQEEIKQALLIAAVDPSIGGVLVLGDRGTGKTTAVRSLGALLPPLEIVAGCTFNCDPKATAGRCASTCDLRQQRRKPRTEKISVPVVDLPLGATEDRIVGALSIGRALAHGEQAFEPGLLARAHRGFLYIDEVNLLEDHLVDVLLDVATSGENIVERDGLSVRHAARFVLVGSGNPEEGELRPQLLDRFGLSVEVRTPGEIVDRVEVVRRRDAYERDPQAFLRRYAPAEQRQRNRILEARKQLADVSTPDEILELASQLAVAVDSDGIRGELTMLRAARALASLDGCVVVERSHLRRIATSALRHRLRRNPLDDIGSTARIERSLNEVLPP
jgi:magnesium chelatase subunit I